MTTIVKMIHGSHLYGLNTENSDTDYKGIYLPSKRDIMLKKYAGEMRSSTGDKHGKNTKDDIDEVIFSLPKFIKMACDGETIAIDMLHCHNPIESHPVWEDLRSKRAMFYTSNMKAFLGYVKRQSAKYGLRGSRLDAMQKVLDCLDLHQACERLNHPELYAALEKLAEENSEHIKIFNGFKKGDKWIDKHVIQVCEAKHDLTNRVTHVYDSIKKKYDSYGHRAQLAKENKGIDWKAISHAIRASMQLKEIYETGDLVYPLKDKDFILDVKLGKLDYTSEVAPIMESLIDDVEVLAEKSGLPRQVDRDFWDDWLIDVYEEYA